MIEKRREPNMYLKNKKLHISLLFSLILVININHVQICLALKGDIDQSGRVDGKDLIIFSKFKGSTVNDSNYNPDADINGDGIINEDDFDILKENFGYTQRDLNVWFTDSDLKKVFRLSHELGEKLAESGTFTNISSIDLNNNDNTAWIADLDSGKIIKLSPKGETVFEISGFNNPKAFVINQNDGSGWVADADNNQVVKLSLNITSDYNVQNDSGFHKTILGFNKPYLLSVNKTDGSCWVADNDKRIVKLHKSIHDGYDIRNESYSFKYHSIFSGLTPNSISVDDSDGSCWVADIQKLELIKIASNNSTELLRLTNVCSPDVVSVNPVDSTCWVSDTSNRQIIRLSSTGSEIFRLKDFAKSKSLSINTYDGGCWIVDYYANQIIKVHVGGNEILRLDNYPSPIHICVSNGRKSKDEPTVSASLSQYMANISEQVTFSGNVNDSAGNISLYEWDFNGDGIFEWNSTETGIATHQYEKEGVYNPIFKVTNNDGLISYSYNNIIRVGALRVKAYADTVIGHAPLQVNFYANYYDPYDGRIQACEWDFDGDMNYDERLNLICNTSHTFSDPGSYLSKVKIIDSGNETAIGTIAITVLASYPSISASIEPEKGPAPLNVTFYGNANSVNGQIILYEWDFDGDGSFDWSSDTTGNTNHSYSYNGIYKPVFKVTDTMLFTSEIEKTITVNHFPEIKYIHADPSKGNIPLTVQFQCLVEDIDGIIEMYDWDFDGDGKFDSVDNNVCNSEFQFSKVGSYEVLLKITDNVGLSTEKTITIKTYSQQNPVASANIEPMKGTFPLNCIFKNIYNNLNNNLTLYEWSFGDEPDNTPEYSWSSSTTGDTTHTYSKPGLYKTSFRVTDDNGKQDIETYEITVYPGTPDAKAEISPDPAKGISPLTINLIGDNSHDENGNIQKYEWVVWTGSHYDYLNDQGAPTRQLFIGPWDSISCSDIVSHQEGIEYEKPFEGKSYCEKQWFVYDDMDGIFDWNDVFRKGFDDYAYSYVEIFSPIDQNVRIKFGSNDAARFWINTNLVFSKTKCEAVAVDQYSFDTIFKKGWNTILVSVSNGDDSYNNYGLTYRITDINNNPLKLNYRIPLSTESNVTSDLSGNAEHTINQPGLYWATLRVTDNDGYIDYDSVQIKVQAPPSITITQPEGNTYIYRDVIFLAECIDHDGKNTLYEWDFDSDGTYEYKSDTTPNTFHIYPTTGAYKATIKVTDDDGFINTQSVNFNIINMPPVITNFSVNYQKRHVNESIKFYGESEDKDGSIKLIECDYEGNNSFVSLPLDRQYSYYTYTQPGIYNAVFRITDDKGSSVSKHIQIEIKEKEAPFVNVQSEVQTSYTGYEVKFLDELDYSKNKILSYEWDFDGNGVFDHEDESKGNVISYSSQYNSYSWKAKNLIDGKIGYNYSWASVKNPSYPQEIIFLLENEKPYKINKVSLNSYTGESQDYYTKDFEIYLSEDGYEPNDFHLCGTFALEKNDQEQFFSFDTTNAKYIKLVILSSQGNNSAYVELAEFKVFEENSNDNLLTKDIVSFTFSEPGRYTPLLKVTDEKGLTDTNITNVNILPFGDSIERIWVADCDNNSVKILSPNAFLIHNQTGFYKPISLAIDQADGSCWVAENANDEASHQIIKMMSDGTASFINGFDTPSKVSVYQADGNCWIADTENNRIVKLNLSGNEPFSIEGFKDPESVSVNQKDGSCWVADKNHDQIVRLSSDGIENLRASGFKDPNDVDVNSIDGSCWIADAGNDRVIKLFNNAPANYNLKYPLVTEDISKQRNYGSINGDVQFINGVIGKAAFFDGESCITIPYRANYRPIEQITLECWFWKEKWTDNSEQLISVSEYGGWNFSKDNSDLLRFYIKINNDDYSVGINISQVATNQWQHIAGTYDGQLVKFYLNGELIDQSEASGLISYRYENAMHIAADASYGTTPEKIDFEGAIDDVRLWSIARTQEEIQYSMNKPLAGNESGLNACWTLNEQSGPFHTEMKGFIYPKYVTVDQKDGSCWVTDYNDKKIVRISEDCQTKLSSIHMDYYPGPVAVSPIDGNIWALDSYYNQVFKFSPNGNLLHRLKGFNDPADIAIYYNNKHQDNSLTAQATATPISGNTPLTVEFDGIAHNSNGNILSYEWDFEGDGIFDYKSTLNGNTSYIYYETGIYHPVFKVTDNEYNTKYINIAIHAGTIEAFVSVPETLIYARDSITFNNYYAKTSYGWITRYEWDFDGDGVSDWNNDENRSTYFRYNYPGLYLAKLQVMNSLGHSAEKSVPIMVRPYAPKAIISTTPNPASGTGPLLVQLKGDHSSDDDGSIVLYEWDYNGDGIFDYFSEIQPNVSFTYAQNGTYTPTLRVTDNDGLKTKASTTVTVDNQTPSVIIDASITKGNAPLTVNFTAKGIDPDGSIESYQWNFDNSTNWIDSEVDNISYTFEEPGKYTASLKVMDNDGASAQAQLKIMVNSSGAPIAVATASPLSSSGQTLPVDIMLDASKSSDADGNIVNYHWYLGEKFKIESAGFSDGGYCYFYVEGYKLDVDYNGYNLMVLNENSLEIVEFGHFGNSENDMKEMVNFINRIKNGRIVLAGINDFSSYGIIEEAYQAMESLGSKYIRNVTGYDTWAMIGRKGAEIGSVDEKHVSSGYGSVCLIENYPVIISETSKTTCRFHRQGIHTVKLVVSDNRELTDETNVNITIGLPEASPEVYPTQGPAPLTVRFISNGHDPDGTIEFFLWDFGDGTNNFYGDDNCIPAIYNKTYDSPGIYKVTLLVRDNDGFSDEKSVFIHVSSWENGNEPIVIAKASPSQGNVPLEVNFSGSGIDKNTFIKSFEWDFDDDGLFDWNSTTNATTTKTFESEGIYKATLRVTDSEGLIGENSILIDVRPAGSPLISTSISVFNSKRSMNIEKSTSTNTYELSFNEQIMFNGSANDPDGFIKQYDWDFDGDGIFDWSSNEQGNVSYRYDMPGIYQAMFQVTDNDGQQARSWLNVNISENELQPVISKESFNPDNGDAITITTPLTFPTKSFSLRVIDINGNTIKTLVNEESRQAGVYSDSWDGKDDNGLIVKSGVYHYVIDYEIHGKTNHFYLTTNISGLKNVFTPEFVDSFNPLGDNLLYSKVVLDKPAIVTAYVSSSENGSVTERIRTNFLNIPKSSGTHIISWDGYTDKGSYAKSGKSYNQSIIKYDLPENAMIVNNTIESSSLSIEPNYFNPDNPYSNNPLHINYNIQREGKVQLIINDVNNKEVYSATQENVLPGKHTFVWDGRDSDGNLFDSGQYSIYIQITDNTKMLKYIRGVFRIYY